MEVEYSTNAATIVLDERQENRSKGGGGGQQVIIDLPTGKRTGRWIK
jgi:hypothetical protein